MVPASQPYDKPITITREEYRFFQRMGAVTEDRDGRQVVRAPDDFYQQYPTRNRAERRAAMKALGLFGGRQ